MSNWNAYVDKIRDTIFVAEDDLPGPIIFIKVKLRGAGFLQDHPRLKKIKQTPKPQTQWLNL